MTIFDLGLRFIEDASLMDSVQTFFPRSKKARIRKKCAKKYRAIVPSKQVHYFQMDGTTIIVIAHPKMMYTVKAALMERANTTVFSEAPLTEHERASLGLGKW